VTAPPPNRNYAFAGALADELARCGVQHVCICPGSRSTPLALALGEHAAIEAHTHIDERAAGFFALGLSKSTRSPVALVCTSGTAAANFLPAVVEASYTGVPLLVLTADRPPELREWGAGQTIDQQRLYGNHVRWFAEVAVPDAGIAMLRYARALACRSVDAATGRAGGPVHLNLPFREPLDPCEVATDIAATPTGSARDGRPGAEPYTRVQHALAAPTPGDTARLAERMRNAKRGIVAVGPLEAGPDAAPAIAELAARLGWPLLAEPASQLRCGPHTARGLVVATADLLLRDAGFGNAHAPDFVLRFGTAPTSKAFRLWLERHEPGDLVLVDPERRFHDPSHLATEILCVDEVALCEHLCRRLPEPPPGPEGWREAFRRADVAIGRVLEAELAEDRLLEPRVVLELARVLPARTRLLVSNSMPIRDVDAFWPASETALRVFTHRGANGIDGLVSSAAGIAMDANGGPVVLLTGDLAFLHDVSGLVAAKRLRVPLAIVVLDNDGGGIFSQLPVARSAEPESFDAFFCTPHAGDLEALATGVGARATRVSSCAHFHTAMKDALSSNGLSVVIVPVDRDGGIEQRQAIVGRIADAVAHR
jgi:2-succinyl-5-enolpyruvyl-6-hydroxy-3-cyclohexene-1-carboxylate synthase